MTSRIHKRFGNPSRFALKFSLSFGLLLWLLAGIDIHKLVAAVCGLAPVMVLAALALHMAATAVGTLKWYRLAREYDFSLLFKITFVAQFYALLIPGQLGGEIVKAYKLNRHRHNPEAIISSILFDRITGWTALLAMGLLTLPVSRFDGAVVLTRHFIAGLGLLAAALWLVQSEAAAGGFKRLALIAPRIERQTKAFADGLTGIVKACRNFLKTPRLLLETFALGLLFHLMGAAIFFVLCRGYGVDIAFFDLCWIFAALSLLLLLPITISGIGLREGGLVVMLGWFSVTPEKALAISLSFFALQLSGAAVGALLEWHPTVLARQRGIAQAAVCEPVRIDRN